MVGLAVVAGIATVLVYAMPGVDVGFRSQSAHVFIETAAALVALLLAYLALQRLRLRSVSTSLLLFGAFLLLGSSNLAFAAVPAGIPSLSTQRFSTWTALFGMLCGAVLLAAAALVPESRVRRPTRDAVLVACGCAGLLAAIAGIVAALGTFLPNEIDPELSPKNAPLIAGNTFFLAGQLVAMCLFLAAALGFARRAEAKEDALVGWIAAGTLLLAFAPLNYFLFPSRFSHWVFAGDFFRIAAYLLLLVGAALEIHSYHRALARAVAVDERRRIARDLHDGLAQELAFIALQAKRLATRVPDSLLDSIVSAADRGLCESRSVIAALTSLGEEPLEEAVAKEAMALAGRSGARVELAVEPGITARFEAREALIRVVREAVTNATRHGHAGVVSVELVAQPQLHLRVADDGTGFDPSMGREGGFGLTSMRERIEGLGGIFRIDSRPGTGTVVEAVLP
jgi:signal transduction histidine kinase